MTTPILIDPCLRKIDYLRLSVTDRCNFRCVYCLPAHCSKFALASELLTNDEILRLASCFAELGVSKIRITGGEPLLRPGIVNLVARLSHIPGVEDLSLSTNGALLKEFADPLAEAGLSRVNISVDTLDPVRFHTITRHGDLNAVFEGVHAALQSGLHPVKINVVIAKGMNDDEIQSFARLTESLPVHVRFIELMPMGDAGFFSTDKFVPMSEMLRKAEPLTPLPNPEWPKGYGPARYFKRPGGLSSVGFISAMSCNFCRLCNRIRLTSRGILYPCLDSVDGVDLRGPLEKDAGTEEIKALISSSIARKPQQHHMLERSHLTTGSLRAMCEVGG